MMVKVVFVLIISLCLICVLPVKGGFTEGAPCSERNTAYANPSKILLPKDPVKCVDITSLSRPLNLQKEWPIRNADTLYANDMNLIGINRTIFKFMPNIELVDYTGNQIRKIPYNIAKIIPHLKIFLLARNRVLIPKKRALMISPTVDTLMLSNNKIRALQPNTFSKVPMLRVLYLDSNYLESVTAKMFSHLTNLKYLHLGNNLLKWVPPRTQMPTSLSTYIVKGNKLEEQELRAKREVV